MATNASEANIVTSTGETTANTSDINGREDDAKMNAINYAERDAATQMGTYGVLTMKMGLPVDLCKRYWRDIHGLIGARIPGFQKNWQHHLAPNERGLWFVPDGIEDDLPPDEQIHGIGEVAFRSEDDTRGMASSQVAAMMQQDEQNLFERTVIYRTAQGNSRTYVDRFADPKPQGRQDLHKLIVFFRAHNPDDVGAFREYMKNRFAATLTESEFVLKLRLHLFEPYDETLWAPPNVRHDCLPEKQYQAAIEIAFRDRLTMNRCFAAPDVVAVLVEQPRHIRTIHAFPEEETYTLVYGGRRTLVGQRGYPIAQTIMQVGAQSQLQEEVTTLLSGRP